MTPERRHPEVYGHPAVVPSGIVGHLVVPIVRAGMAWARGGGVDGPAARRIAGALSSAPDHVVAAHCDRALLVGLAVLADVERMDGRVDVPVTVRGRLVPLLERLLSVDVPVMAAAVEALSRTVAHDLSLHLRAGGRIEGDWGSVIRGPEELVIVRDHVAAVHAPVVGRA